ncbi:hypothetical protein EI94DRAFT_1818440 [Lactarius quietus]|nr:hypothetical protein EI94DRAFT_1818440 [Lactarius quietus]
MDPEVHTDTLDIPSSGPPGPVLDDITGTAEGSPEAGSHEDTDDPDSTSMDRATHANTIALDLSPQPSTIDIYITDPSGSRD